MNFELCKIGCVMRVLMLIFSNGFDHCHCNTNTLLDLCSLCAIPDVIHHFIEQ